MFWLKPTVVTGLNIKIRKASKPTFLGDKRSMENKPDKIQGSYFTKLPCLLTVEGGKNSVSVKLISQLASPILQINNSIKLLTLEICSLLPS